MEYKIDTYKGDNDNRFVLGKLGKHGKKKLFVLGLNPSTADDKEPDPTMRKVMRLAEINGFDGFVMLNLYPKQSPKPGELPGDNDCNEEMFIRNLKEIAEVVPNNAVVLACWGVNIHKRAYLSRSLSLITKELENKHCIWKAIKSTKYGDPQHPSRAKYGEFIEFDIKNYLKILNRIRKKNA